MAAAARARYLAVVLGRPTGARRGLRIPAWLVLAGLWTAVIYSLTSARLLSGVRAATPPELPSALTPNAGWIVLPVAGLLLLASYGVGRRLLRKAEIPWTSPWQVDLVAPLVGLVLFGLALLLAGAAGLLRGGPLLLLFAAAVAAGRAEIRQLVRRLPPAFGTLRQGIGLASALSMVLLAAFTVLGAFLAAAPETNADALQGHLYAVAQYVAAGRFVAPPFYEMTHGPELAHVLWVPLWHLLRDAGPKGLVFVQGGLMVLLAAVVASELAGRRAGWFAALIALATPAFLPSCTTAQPDAQLALFGSSALWIALRFGHVPHGALLCGILSGAAAATSYVGVFFIAASALLSLWAGATNGIVLLRDRKTIAPVWQVIGGAAAVAGAFYVKNWVTLGNPFYPLFAADLGSYLFTLHEIESVRRAQNADVPLLPLAYLGGLLLSGAALAPAALDDRRVRGLGLAALIVFAVFALGARTWSWLLALVPLASALVAASLERLRQHGRAGRIGYDAATVVVLCTAVLHLPFFQGSRIPMRVAVGGESRAAYLRRNLPAYGIAEDFNTRNPEYRILALPESDERMPAAMFGSALVRNSAAVRIWHALLADGQPAPAALHAALRANQITHLLVRRDAADPRPAALGAESAFGRHYLKRLDSNGPYTLYLLKPRMAELEPRRAQLEPAQDARLALDLLQALASADKIPADPPEPLVRELLVESAGQRVRTITTLAGGAVVYSIEVPPRARFESNVTMPMANGDGAIAVARFEDAYGAHELVRLPLQPGTAGWQPVSADLASFAGREGRLILSTEPGPGGDTTGDWVSWAMPRIVTVSSDGRP